MFKGLAIILATLVFSCAAFAQVTTVYTQRHLSPPGKIGIYAIGPADTTGMIVGFLKKGGFFFLDPQRREAWMDTTYPRAGLQDAAYLIPWSNGFVSLMHSDENDHCLYDAEKGFRQLPIPDSLRAPAFYGMYHLPDNDYILSTTKRVVSPDLGSSWYRYPDSLVLGNLNQIGYASIAFWGAQTKRIYRCIVENSQLTVQPTPMRGAIDTRGAVGMTANLHANEVVWTTNTPPVSVRMGSYGDTSFRQVPPFRVGDSVLNLAPNKLFRLQSGAVLYIDSSGRYARIDSNGTLPYSGIFPTSESWMPEYRGTTKCVLPQRNAWAGFAFLNLTDPPTYDTWRYSTSLGGASGLFDVGSSGIVASRVERGELFFDVQRREIVITGSILRDFDILAPRRMMFCHEATSGRQTILNDCDVLLTTSGRIGLALLGDVRAADFVAFRDLISNPNSVYPSESISMVVVNDTTLMFPGPVVRTISTTGQTLDTLLTRPTSFVSRLDDGTLVSGNRGVLRFHRSELDTVAITPIDLQGAEITGYPSCVTSAGDGSLLCGVMGVWRRHPDSAEARTLTWGGILRTTDGGETWSSIPLPDPRSNHVLSISRTASNALIAVTLRMEEDTIPTTLPNAEPSAFYSSYVKILRSTDNGQNWSSVNDVFYNGQYSLCAGSLFLWDEGSNLSIATPGGLFHSRDDGRTWEVDVHLPFVTAPVSLSRGTGGTMLISSTTGVYRLDRPTSVVMEGPLDPLPVPHTITRSALISRIRSTTSSSVTLTNLVGEILEVGPLNIHKINSLPVGVYVLCADQRVQTIMLNED